MDYVETGSGNWPYHRTGAEQAGLQLLISTGHIVEGEGLHVHGDTAGGGEGDNPSGIY